MTRNGDLVTRKGDLVEQKRHMNLPNYRSMSGNFMLTNTEYNIGVCGRVQQVTVSFDGSFVARGPVFGCCYLSHVLHSRIFAFSSRSVNFSEDVQGKMKARTGEQQRRTVTYFEYHINTLSSKAI